MPKLRGHVEPRRETSQIERMDRMEKKYTIESRRKNGVDWWHRACATSQYGTIHPAREALIYHKRLRGSDNFEYRIKKELIQYYPDC